MGPARPRLAVPDRGACSMDELDLVLKLAQLAKLMLEIRKHLRKRGTKPPES